MSDLDNYMGPTPRIASPGRAVRIDCLACVHLLPGWQTMPDMPKRLDGARQRTHLFKEVTT